MTLHVARSPRFREHDPGPWHPERPERLVAVDRALDAARQKGLVFDEVELRSATSEELATVHTEALLARLESARGRAIQLDPDTSTSTGSVDAARLAVGSLIDLTRTVAAGSGDTGLALVRPPGHHAVPQRSMGFCLYSNVAIAVKRLLDRAEVERVAVYDWDVHHGNGTQAVFYDDPRVLFMSTHQWPFYPGTGSADERGGGAGEGTTINLPLPAGTSDEALLAATEDVLAPAVRAFSPDLIVISAGFDAHVEDPIGGLRVTTRGFEELALRWRDLAEEFSEGRILGVLEGGYDLDALADSVGAVARAWA